MSKRYTIPVLAIALLYVVYHLVTLSCSPLPWFDEVSFASITNSYIRNHTFYQEAINITTHGQNAMYGPLFFALQAGIIKLCGWSMFSFRISNLLFGFGCLYLVYKVCRHLQFSAAATAFTMAILALDRSYNQFLHSGRMDFMTLFFFLASYLLFVRLPGRRGLQRALLAVCTGIMLSAALLTTPRVIFAFSFYACYFIYELYEQRRGNLKEIIFKYALIAGTVAMLFLLWIYGEFGSLHNYIYVNYTSNKIIQGHVGFSMAELRPNSGMLYFAYAFICFGVLLGRRQAYRYRELVLFTVPVIITFLCLVGGGFAGRYYAMVAPFTTVLFVGVGIQVLHSKWLKLANYTLIVLLVLGFLFKAFYIMETTRQRDPVYNEQRIMQYIPNGATVAGDFAYYYFARRHNCTFQSLQENGTQEAVLQYFAAGNYGYFIFNKDNGELDTYKARVLKDRYTLVATIGDPPSAGWLPRIINKLGYKITESYACYIYKYNGAAQ